MPTPSRNSQPARMDETNLFLLNLPPKFLLGVPDREILDSVPAGLEDKFMRVSCGEGQTKYIRKGRWLAPEYYADEMQNGLHYGKESKYEKYPNTKKVETAKDNAYRRKCDALEQEIEQLKDSYRKERGNADMWKRQVGAWQSAYEALEVTNRRVEIDCERQHSLRLIFENETIVQREEMAKKIFQTQGVLEEDVIEEAKLNKLYEGVRSAVANTINFLKHKLSEENMANLESLRGQLNFDFEAAMDLQFMDVALGSMLLETILLAVEKEYYTRATRWLNNSGDAKNLSIDDNPLKLEKAMLIKVHALRRMDHESGKFHVRSTSTPTTERNRAALESLTSAYYCWRANTAKMQNLLAETFPDDHAQPAEIQAFLARKITTDFLVFLAQVLPGEGGDPTQIFYQYGLTDAHIQQRTRALEKNISSCVEKALQLFSEMRLGRCHYGFQNIPNGPLQSEVTEIYGGQRESLPKSESLEQIWQHLRTKYCVYPALVKYGDNYGKNFHLKEVLTPAQVVVDIDLSSEPKQDNDKSSPNSGKEKKSLMRKAFSMVKTTLVGDEYEVEDDSIDKIISEEDGPHGTAEDDTLPHRLEVTL